MSHDLEYPPGLAYRPQPKQDRRPSTLQPRSPYNHTPTPSLSLRPPSSQASNASLSTVWWGELEPWMDDEYAKQVCALMGWDPVSIRVPQPPPDPLSGQQANNPGYCFLTFATPSQAANVLTQIGGLGRASALTMPNSSKPFVMNWASAVPSALAPPVPAASTVTPPAVSPSSQQTSPAQYQKEYSIFVGDLAPETSNSDLVAVFRNPVLGLRNDREPKFIRPFLSCKSAKIMLDPVTGVSRGYGFVRFTDEADQQRALIEMHGLYCLSRPMRISPATAKFKPPQGLPAYDAPQPSLPAPIAEPPLPPPLPVPVPVSNGAPVKSVSTPIAASSNIPGSSSGTSIGGSQSSNSLSSVSTASISSSVFADPAQLKGYPSYDDQFRQFMHPTDSSRYLLSEDAWKHHAQARAILGNLIGPNGEQLTSTDPYNTTVFVGGLSPLISEDTLRTFFAPFGDIHYVKVPVGKHCGFVQFVRKADAERAIEKMQGFPIGGSRIRLSWGRSQYKAAQAAAQAAQAAVLQAQAQMVTPPPASLSQEQSLQMLHKYNTQHYYDPRELENQLLSSSLDSARHEVSRLSPEGTSAGLPYISRSEMHRTQSNFSPFSPDPTNIYTSSDRIKRETSPFPPRLDSLHSSAAGPSHALHGKEFSPGFFGIPQELKVTSNGKISPPRQVQSATRYGFADVSDPPAPLNRAPTRPEGTISRPGSGTTSRDQQEPEGIQDLNGTLASLNLDWQSPDVGQKPV